MLHKKIRTRQQSGVINDDSDFLRTRETIEHLMLEEMREEGHIPILDLGPSFSTELVGEHYRFLITFYSVYVGRKKSWTYLGIDTDGKMYPMTITQKNRSDTL